MYEEWIRAQLERTGKTQVELARAMGIGPVKLSKSLAGNRRFQIDEIENAARFFGVAAPVRHPIISSYDPDHVEKDETAGEAGVGVNAREMFPPEAIVELIARGGLGSGQVITSIKAGDVQTDEVKDDYWRFPHDFARGVLGAMPIHMIVVACTGDSMEPTLSSNERVWVNTLHKKPSPDGLYAIRDIFEGVIIKRLEIVRGDPPRLRIISDNARHPPQEVGMEEVNIVGKVLCALRLF